MTANYIEKALEQLDKYAPNGAFSSKVDQKRVLDTTQDGFMRAVGKFSLHSEAVAHLLRQLHQEGRFEVPDSAYTAYRKAPKDTREDYERSGIDHKEFAYLVRRVRYSTPNYLHQWNKNRADALLSFLEFIPDGPERDKYEDAAHELIEVANQLRELRDEIAEMPIDPVMREENPGEIAIRGLVKSVHEERNAAFLKNVSLDDEIYEKFGVRLNIGATSHYVTNAFGTTFVRTMYYLNYRRESLANIVAAMEQLGVRFDEV